MEERFREITGIGERMPSFVLSAGSAEEAEKWERLILFLAEFADDSSETGHDTPPLQDNPDFLCRNVFDTLGKMGIEIPPHFPQELDRSFDDEDENDDAMESFFTEVGKHPVSRAIRDIFDALTNVYGFYAAYICEIEDDNDLDLLDIRADVESCLLELAACKVEVDPTLAPRFNEFRYETRKIYTKWLTAIKEKAFRAGIPLKAELLDMIHADPDALGQEAEARSFGFTGNRLHPDIYMNELLVGMRTIHQVLPVILKKLGIYEEFQLDTSAFYCSTPNA
jgi:hypothetical protein